MINNFHFCHNIFNSCYLTTFLLLRFLIYLLRCFQSLWLQICRMWKRVKNLLIFSVFEGCIIPYPKREFLTDEEEDKGSVATSKVSNCTSNDVSWVFILVISLQRSNMGCQSRDCEFEPQLIHFIFKETSIVCY